MRKFKVSESEAGKRVDIFVASKFPKFSRSALATLFKNQMVKINGKLPRPAYKLKPSDSLEVNDKLLKSRPAKVRIPVIYEDGEVIVMDKPAGMLTHSKGALNLEGTVASFIAPKVIDMKGNRAGIVHRLDRGTSGVIIAAKTVDALKHLQKQFSTRKVVKTYIAVVSGKPQPATGVIDAPIARNPKNPKQFKVTPTGKPAQTEYNILRSNGSFSLLMLKPKTGRTHQLRVHLKHIGHPIVGDEFYGGEPASRLMLHAASLKLVLPDGETKEFESKLPSEIDEYVSK